MALSPRTLVLVMEAAGDRVVGVVHPVDEIGDRELQLMGPEPPGPRRRGQVVARPRDGGGCWRVWPISSLPALR
jgi:hypothetical protein